MNDAIRFHKIKKIKPCFDENVFRTCGFVTGQANQSGCSDIIKTPLNYHLAEIKIVDIFFEKFKEIGFPKNGGPTLTNRKT